MKTHYIAMSGLAGCLPDTCQSFSRLQDAIDFLSDLWSEYRGVKYALCKYKYWERNDPDYTRGDLQYCEIVSCNCDNPSIHNDL
jgi:hypothetical protein